MNKLTAYQCLGHTSNQVSANMWSLGRGDSVGIGWLIFVYLGIT
jgi:hypothetical protein